MSNSYKHLTTQERAVVMTMRDDHCSIRSIAKRLCRSASTIGRELKRTSGAVTYDANAAHLQSQARRFAVRRVSKLDVDSVLFKVVRHQLSLLWSPQQIARKLRALWPDNPEKSVSHETIYNAIYLHPRGELKRELIACLRHHNQVRKPRSRGTDRRHQIPDMQSIHIRPPEIEDRLIPGHWEGDLIKGAGNRSSVGTLVERTTGFVVLAKMDNATTKAVVDSFSAVLNREPAAMRKTMTYDQGREMYAHKILTERTGVQIYFADPHSPWQRGSNENTNGLLRQYMPKGSDLSIYSQDELDAIALSLNTRPRARLNYESPLVVYTQHITLLQAPTTTVN
ncbi:IS30 family transposase [Janthinobacterium lividum]|uniref:IS30 family transposase n=1 Tax=Janthinobacterium lividum TaxID=29581 RepID=A0A1B8NPC7_9BURK|nr:IS30 family transposase [Janthinobacterium lividum]OFJ48701.1 IS30 family transposase [Janthinobacterium lividum]OFJ49078.1 IS30 family transposase [Janthinobacterium lividum]OFJ49522.1 IS30 family transposase [Janthinobacterium lividum]OFJ49921.1 IS30 family transposase [Janthinobacterium lividum]